MSEMYSVACFFPWLPRNYEYVGSILAVFNISAEQLVSVRTDMHNNILVFSVASLEVFNSLEQFLCRVLFFPLMDHNILECFAYPESPRYRFVRIAALLANILPGNLNGRLAGLGTVLYHHYICHETPLTADFRSDTIGVVLYVSPDSQCLPGYGQQVQTGSTAMPYVPVAAPSSGGNVALQQPSPVLSYLPQQGAVLQPSVYLNPFQRPQVHVFGCIGADGNFRRDLDPYSYGNRAPTMGGSSPAQDPAAEDSGDEGEVDPSSEDEYPETSPDEGYQEDLNK